MLDIFFPTYCINCKRSGEYLCQQCQKKLKNSLPECYYCRKISPKYKTHKNCKKYNLENVFVGWEYNEVAKRILSQYKYKQAFKLSETLSNLLIHRLEITGFSKQISPDFTLVPMPIHSKHKRDRGFNQSLLIANHLQKYFKCHLDRDLLKRVSNSHYQSQQSLENRLKLSESIFYAKGNTQTDSVILIDDVISTGTTLNMASKSLNCKNISAITLFRGKPRYQYLRK